MSELRHLAILEQKILQALHLIHQLRQENASLKSEVERLKQQLQETEHEFRDLQQKIPVEPGADGVEERYRRREAEIRSRVEKMLAKLESLDIPL